MIHQFRKTPKKSQEIVSFVSVSTNKIEPLANVM